MRTVSKMVKIAAAGLLGLVAVAEALPGFAGRRQNVQKVRLAKGACSGISVLTTNTAAEEDLVVQRL